jgi:ribonuclease P protein component
MLPLHRRIKEKEEFERFFHSKKTIRVRSLLLTLYVVPSKKANSRFGFVVGTKVSKRATIRNKLKRRMRAVVARALPAIKPGIDALLIARPQAEEATFQEVEKTITNLLQTARLI